MKALNNSNYGFLTVICHPFQLCVSGSSAHVEVNLKTLKYILLSKTQNLSTACIWLSEQEWDEGRRGGGGGGVAHKLYATFVARPITG